MKSNFLTKGLMVTAISALAFFAFAEQEKVIRVFSGGNIINEYNASDIDYIQVDDLISAPENLNASVIAGSAITIKWAAVEGATYSVFRSPDNVNFTLLAKDLEETTYTDNSPLRGSNYYRVSASVNGVESGYTTSVAATLPDNGMESGIYLGIYGFNQAVYEYPVLRLDESSIGGFNEFVDALTMKNGTLLYYSVEQALDDMQSTQYPSDISNVALVTFTDGLDQGSMMKNDAYEDDMEYLDALNKRITTQTVAGKQISAYSIGVRGSDVADISLFKENLKKLASSPENATEVTSMSEVNAKFQDIAQQLSKSNYVQTINLKMPGVANGTLVRFTFDNVNDASKSSLYIEGNFNLKNKSLDNVKYVGMTSTSGESVKGTVEDIFVSFTFEGIQTEGNILIKSEFTDEWTFVTSNSLWQINSEFDKSQNSEIRTERSSAAIMLVLDCSSSLADQFTTAQQNAKGFIKTLYEAAGMTIDPENPENPNESDVTIYSTTPIDLSIAIWKDNTRYFLTVEQYQNANLKDAIVEGLAVVAATGNFIISPHLIQSGTITKSCAMSFYEQLMPDKNQATVISARYLDINDRLSLLGWEQFKSNSLSYYMTRTSYNSGYNYQIHLYRYSGGQLASDNSSGYNSTYGYIRGVVSASNSAPILWNDSNDLKLSVKKDGERVFISNTSEDLSQYDDIEGIYVSLGGNKFIIKLHDEQSGSITRDAAMSLYSDILPDWTQAIIISMKYLDINNALRKWGGSPLDTDSSSYYMTKTLYSGSYNYQLHLYRYTGGQLASDNNSGYNSIYGYIRGVITLEQGE